jgi:hypothetical protein
MIDVIVSNEWRMCYHIVIMDDSKGFNLLVVIVVLKGLITDPWTSYGTTFNRDIINVRKIIGT